MQNDVAISAAAHSRPETAREASGHGKGVGWHVWPESFKASTHASIKSQALKAFGVHPPAR
jgi:hypothetical protein